MSQQHTGEGTPCPEPPQQLKRCRGCSAELPLDQFGANGKQTACRTCRKRYQKKWNDSNKDKIAANQKRSRDKHPDRVRDTARRYYARDDVKERKDKTRRRARLRYAFDMTLEEYEVMLEAQGGVCAICRQSQTGRHLAVDHNHSTGQVRGLLCTVCNMGIGASREALDWFDRAKDYLERHNGSTQATS